MGAAPPAHESAREREAAQPPKKRGEAEEKRKG